MRKRYGKRRAGRGRMRGNFRSRRSYGRRNRRRLGMRKPRPGKIGFRL